MKIFLLMFLMFIVFSCNNKSDKQTQNVTDSINTKKDSIPKMDVHYFWSTDVDATSGLSIIKTTPITNDSLNAAAIISKMNMTYPDVKLEFVKQSSDSIFLKISNAKYLTQQMGSTGAQSYLAEVTYNLTEVPDIHYVDLKFKEGDHADPRTYARTDFIQFVH